MNAMLSSGVELMLVGMGIVFGFLAMLIVMINIMTWVVERFFPPAQAVPAPKLPAHTLQTNDAVIVAIGAAVHQYRTQHK